MGSLPPFSPSIGLEKPVYTVFQSIAAGRTMKDKTTIIGQIIGVMRDHWDLPSDCNEGELFTYAEILFDRMSAGEDRDELCSYLANVQVEKLKMPSSEAYREIVNGSIVLLGRQNSKSI
jgi:hypothetical protein